MSRYRLEEIRAGTLTSSRVLSGEELQRERPELSAFLDEGLTSLHLVTQRREVRLKPFACDQERLRFALELAGCDLSDEELARLIAGLRRAGEFGLAATH
jgi:hypothetical protein